MGCLTRDFYNRPSEKVARNLLGKVLWRQTSDGKCSGRIVEVEAYEGNQDSASHAFRGRTARNASMFGPPGHAYVYTIHNRWCLNVVTEPEGVATAVLIRALEPLGGLELMMERRKAGLLAGRARLAARRKSDTLSVPDTAAASDLVLKPLDLCRGPARLCEALAVNRDQDGCDITVCHELWIEDDPMFRLSPRQIAESPRIGISSAQDRLLRFFIRDNPFVSGK
jgi:DNA-3-methyladenine glycosylase